MTDTASQSQMRTYYRQALKRMETQDDAEGVRYFTALLGGSTEAEAVAIASQRPSDLIDDGYGLRARGGLVYFG